MAGAQGSIVGVVLAAGLGTRLQPLTFERPKALCPVGGRALVDLALERLSPVTDQVAVNAHHHARRIADHLAGRRGGRGDRPVHLSVEEAEPLGTAGALGRLRPWIEGRSVLVVNADAWCEAPLAPLLTGWDGATVRVLVHGEHAFHPRSRVAGALLPWSDVVGLPDAPAGLYETCWRAAAAGGRLEAVRFDGPFVDCGTPADYLAANLLASGGASVIDPSAEVGGTVVASVVWDGASVRPGEHLWHAIRMTTGRTVLVR